jgi:uncharacterized protein (DUF58 family)
MKPKLNFWILLAVIITLLILQGYLQDKSIERTIYFLIILVIISFLITKNSTVKLSITRSTRENRQQVGQYFTEKYEISNQKILPILWISLVDKSGLSSENDKRLIAWIPGNSTKVLVNQSILDKRGVFTLGPTRVVSGDPFGIFTQTITYQSNVKLIVIPSYEKLHSFPEPLSSLTGGAAHKSRDTEVSPYAVSIREFYPGDPLRRIDWKSTARLDKLMVKEFEEDPQAIVWVLMDGNEEVHYRLKNKKTNESDTNRKVLFEKFERREFNLPDDTFEYEISFAASICDYYIDNGRSIGFGANCQNTIAIAPERGTRQLDKVLEILSSLSVAPLVKFPEFLISQSSLIQKGSSVVLITSNTGNELIQAIEMLNRRNIAVILVSVNPKEFGKTENTNNFYNVVKSMDLKVMEIRKGERLSDKIYQLL